MALPDGFADGQSLQALDENQQLLSKHGHGVVSGCSVSIYSRNLGSGEATVEVAAGELLVDGSTVSITSDTVSVAESNVDPRKDIIVYDPSQSSGNRLLSIQGEAEDASPTGSARQQAEIPAPPSLESDVDAVSEGGDPRIPLSEVWVPEDVDSITSDDLFDRRQGTDHIGASVQADVDVTTPEISGDVSTSAITTLDGTNLSVNSGTLDATDTRTDISDSGTAVVSDVTDINLGNNLDVADDGDGSVTVDSAETTTLYMSDRSSGGVIDNELDQAVTDASPGDTIVLDRNDYELTQQVVVDKSLTIDQTEDSTLTCSNTANNNAHILVQGSGIQATTTTSAATDQGQRVIPVNDASIFTADDRVMVISEAYGETVNAFFHIDKVESVDTTNNEITIKGSLSRGFASGVEANQIDLLQGPTLKNITTTGGGNRHLQFRWCENPTFRDVTVTNYLEVSLYTLDCWKARYYDVEATDPTGLGSGEGEPIALYRVQDAYIESPRVQNCRRGIDTSRGTHNLTIVDPVIRGVDRNGISIHQNDPTDRVTIIGGEIVCDANGASGNGITSADSTTMTITGTRIIARANGIIASGPTQISNVEIKPVEGVSGSHVAGINIQHGDTQITNTTIDDPNGLFDFGVWVNTNGINMENFHIDVETRHPGANHVYIDGRNGTIDDVKVRGTLDNVDGASDHAMFIRADNTHTVTNIDVSITAEGFDEQGVRLLSTSDQLSHVNFHDCYFETALAAIYDDGGSYGSIRVSDSTIISQSDTQTALSFNDTIDTLHVHGNTVYGTVDTTGTIGSLYEEGNLNPS